MAVAKNDIEMIAHAVTDDLLAAASSASAALMMSLPKSVGGRSVLVADRTGRIVGAWPDPHPGKGHTLADVLGTGQPLTTFAEQAGVLQVVLADGTEALAMVRSLKGHYGQVAVIQSVDAALDEWRLDAALLVTLFSTTGGILLILGFAFHWQSLARTQADAICDRVRQRVDTALNRGRCGLWDWDIARGPIYLVGLDVRDARLRAARASSCRSASQPRSSIPRMATSTRSPTSSPARGRRQSTTRSASATSAATGCGCASAPSWCATGRAIDPHLVGITIDITEQKRLADDTETADARLRDAIETISEAFVAVGRRQPAGDVQFASSRSCTTSPNSDVRPAPTYEQVTAASRPPSSRPSSDDQCGDEAGAAATRPSCRTPAGSRSTSAAPRTAATSRSAPTSPRCKRQEEHLLDSERRLTATVADLKRSRQTLKLQAQQLADLAER